MLTLADMRTKIWFVMAIVGLIISALSQVAAINMSESGGYLSFSWIGFSWGMLITLFITIPFFLMFLFAVSMLVVEAINRFKG